MLDKTYSPAEAEQKHYQQWEEAGVFAASPVSDAVPYTIMMPPPNVTGSLHMGHALTFTLQDLLIRYHRMTGHNTLWQPGTDHAGIATQMVVERNLAADGVTRHDLGRDAFIEKVWEWKEQSGGTITRQLRRLGASPDWARERFTMDEGLSHAVRTIFVRLHKDGLIYRDKRLVNWDTRLHTAISDLEVEQRDVKGKMWYFRYPVDGSDEFVTVGTTRPETMLGDTAVAVHPDDERFRHLHGKMVRLPITGRLVPVVPDDYADPEKGTGAVKITPAHDFNDFEVGKRNGLRVINIFDRDARILSEALEVLQFSGGHARPLLDDAGQPVTETLPERFRGVDRFVAREMVVAEIEELGLFEKVEQNPMTVPYGDRSGVVIEPWLTDQWFVDAPKLAAGPIEAVESGRTRFVPKQWEKTFFDWMRNIQPWCVSRQIWWGHQIPAWFGPDGTPFVEMDEASARQAARQHYGQDVDLQRDPDVLDTWFSSALWPFSTIGWPEKTPELDRFYPTSVLVTGFDIIFFWVARMMMFGMYATGEVPFRDVYIHALVRDEKGQKMSKSKGNVIDPLVVVDQYGTDALRFTLAAMAAQGRDIKMSENRVAGYRNFVTKLWNAARFCQMNDCAVVPSFDPHAVTLTLNQWIIARTALCAAAVKDGIDSYRFNDAANAAYQFVWGSFCDWFLEFAKPVFTGEDEAARSETRATAAWVLDQILMLLHPFMPFVTEELWGQLAPRSSMLVVQQWPSWEGLDNAAARQEMDWVVEAISSVRSVRAEMGVPPGIKMPMILQGAGEQTRQRLDVHRPLIERLARLDSITLGEEVPKASAQVVLGEALAILPLEGVIDIAAEKQRLAKELGKQETEAKKLAGKLANQGFVAKASPDVVEEHRERLAEAEAAISKLSAALSRLG